mgnify:CR=1 FL=1
MPKSNHMNVEKHENKDEFTFLISIIRRSLQRLLRLVVVPILGILAAILLIVLDLRNAAFQNVPAKEYRKGCFGQSSFHLAQNGQRLYQTEKDVMASQSSHC